MNNRLPSKILRLNTTTNTFINSLKRSNKTNGKLNTNLSFRQAEIFIKSSFINKNAVSLNTLSVFKSLRGVPLSDVFIGRIHFTNEISKIVIKFSYFSDKTDLGGGIRGDNFVLERFIQVKKYLSSVWKKPVVFIVKNIHDCLWKACRVFGHTKVTYSGIKLNMKRNIKVGNNSKRLLKKISVKKRNKKKGGIKKTVKGQLKVLHLMYLGYNRFYKSFQQFHKNEYFGKISQAVYVCFLYRNIECGIITQVVSGELSRLKKGHISFFRCISEMFTHIFNQSNQKDKVKGLSLTLKGRLVLKNRQTPRKKKFVLTLGKQESTQLNSFTADNTSLSVGKLGIVSVRLKVIKFRLITRKTIFKTIHTNHKTGEFSTNSGRSELSISNYSRASNRLVAKILKDRRVVRWYVKSRLDLENRANFATNCSTLHTKFIKDVKAFV